MKRALSSFVGVMLGAWTGITAAAQYQIAVQPVLPPYQIQQAYRPLANYLSESTGHSFSISTYKNFLTYWESMKRQKGFDFVLDAAHFTDWRVKRQDYTVLAKLPDTVSFSLVTHEDLFVFEPDELVLKKVATMPSPGLGGIRLNNMFPNPVRLPILVLSTDSNDAAKRVINGKADAAIIPTPMLQRYEGLNLVDTTEPVPHMGFSASSKVPEDVRETVRNLLLNAPSTDAGRRMLSELNLGDFQPADETVYEGYAELLQDVFGY